MALIPNLFGERPCKMVDRDFFRPINQVVPHDYFKQFENMFRTIDQLSSIMNNMAMKERTESDYEKFQLNVDVQHFAPEDISVKVVNGFVTVEGKHEERLDEHGYVSRQFVRRYALPEGCLPDTVESKLSSDGVLIITAPKVLPMPSTGERIVPIIKTGPVKKQIEQ
ncbi:protein lethal(2)essential for life-like [Maniola hyperantus]|uniref:protein lethal(2)essential for life-like n=1 Tax=Aphantopus hyperantus TaxID=2795564 RepID=UPI0015695CB8|nr:protein lethal(2)essential for life-like [Maniola hyperantus]